MGKLRQAWCDHVGIGDEELRRAAPTLGITQRFDFEHELHGHLNDRLRAVGLVSVPASEAGCYNDFITKLRTILIVSP